MSLITLFSDASWCPQSKVGAYACWWKTDGITGRDSGVLKGPCISAEIAELFGLANGIWLVLRRVRPGQGSKIIAQTDCVGAIGILKGTRRTPPAEGIACADMVRAMLQQAGVRVEYRHVKGHRGVETPRNAVNSWCDRAARDHMRAARNAEAQP